MRKKIETQIHGTKNNPTRLESNCIICYAKQPRFWDKKYYPLIHTEGEYFSLGKHLFLVNHRHIGPDGLVIVTRLCFSKSCIFLEEMSRRYCLRY